MKKLIKLTESDLHNIVKESVNRILKEYTNGYTERLYTNSLPQAGDTPARIARKQGVRNYLSDRYKRENNLTDDQVDAIINNDSRSLTNAKLPGTFLKRLDQGENMSAARGMSNNLRNRRPKPEESQPKINPKEAPNKKKGLFGLFK